MLTSLWKANKHPELNRDIVYPGSAYLFIFLFHVYSCWINLKCASDILFFLLTFWYVLIKDILLK